MKRVNSEGHRAMSPRKPYNVSLPVALHDKLKTLAAERYTNVSQLLTQIVMDYLERREQKKPKPSKPKLHPLPEDYAEWDRRVFHDDNGDRPILYRVGVDLDEANDALNPAHYAFRTGDRETGYRLWREFMRKYPQLHIPGLSPSPNED